MYVIRRVKTIANSPALLAIVLAGFFSRFAQPQAQDPFDGLSKQPSLAQTAGERTERNVIVCIELEASDPNVVQTAETRASMMFARIDVALHWQHKRDCPSEGIVISLEHSSTGPTRNTLGSALPYEGRHISLFYEDIVRLYRKPVAPTVLAHVFVHEITHMIEGICRHSSTGVMKAHWSQGDILLMRWKPLEFAREDITLIRGGLARRMVETTKAINAAPDGIATR